MGVMQTFGVSQVAATLGLTLFVAGYGVGPLLWSPMSEIPQFGRNPIYIATLRKCAAIFITKYKPLMLDAVVFVLFQIPTALATNFGMLLAFRFLTGFFGSPALATGGATIADMYKPSKQAYGLSIWGIGAVCGPCLGPLVGGFAAQAEGWTWTIWELMWLSGFCWVFLFFLLPETSSANILYRRTQRLRKLTGNDKLICEPELMAEQMTGKDIVQMTLVRPISLTFTEPMVFFLNLYIVSLFAQIPNPTLTFIGSYLRSSIHLVRIFPPRLCRTIRIQSRTRRSRFSGHLGWCSYRHGLSFRVPPLLPREAIQFQRRDQTRDSSSASNGWQLLCAYMPFLVRLEQPQRYTLDRSHHRFEHVWYRSFPAIPGRTTVPIGCVSGIYCECICGQRPLP